jgi:hypothetical protein
MRTRRQPRARTVLSGLAMAWGCLVLQGGCGESVDVSKPAYTSSEEERQRSGLTDAMKGGAYGKAGKAAAAQPVGIPK